MERKRPYPWEAVAVEQQRVLRELIGQMTVEQAGPRTLHANTLTVTGTDTSHLHWHKLH